MQVNTSGEDTKSGVEPDECLPLVSHIVEQCPGLSFAGLMTIGKAADAECFECLVSCRAEVCSNMAGLGVELDLAANVGRISVEKLISTPSSKVQVWVIPTNEELQIAQDTVEILKKM